jgi:hypothetical protein
MTDFMKIFRKMLEVDGRYQTPANTTKAMSIALAL